MANRSIEGKHLRWLIAGAVAEYFTKVLQKPAAGEDFQYYVDDTCNRTHKYLTAGGGTTGWASDLQCSIAIDAAIAFNVKLGDEVTIYW
jgi:hypothetical protein